MTSTPRTPTPRLKTPEERSSFENLEETPEAVSEDTIQTSSPAKIGKLKVPDKDQPKLTIAMEVFGESHVAQCLSKNLGQNMKELIS